MRRAITGAAAFRDWIRPTSLCKWFRILHKSGGPAVLGDVFGERIQMFREPLHDFRICFVDVLRLADVIRQIVKLRGLTVFCVEFPFP